MADWRAGEAEWRFVREGVAFYHDVAPLIRDGIFRCVRSGGASWQQLTGRQIATVTSRDGAERLVVWHRFAGDDASMELAWPDEGRWRIAREWSDALGVAVLQGNRLAWAGAREWTGGVLWLERGDLA